MLNLGWKPFNGAASLRLKGLSAGQDSLGQEVYIGRGYYRDELAPGKLLIDAPTAYRGVGLYVENSRAEQFITSNKEYFEKEPTCEYKWVASSNGQRVTNAIEYTTHQFTFYVGRVFAQGSVEVGKVPSSTKTMYYGKGHQINSYEVLTCEKITPGNFL